MKRWEYKVEQASDGIEFEDGELDSLGLEGWELVSVVFGRWTDGRGERSEERIFCHAYFKRCAGDWT